jgi:hypothetical protein
MLAKIPASGANLLFTQKAMDDIIFVAKYEETKLIMT